MQLNELVDIFLGVTHTPQYVDKGVPFLSVKDISGGKIVFDNCKYISKEEYDSLPNGAKPQVGDMLFCRVGTLGKPIIIEENTPVFGSFVSLGFLRNKNEKICNIKYLLYWMNSNSFWEQVYANVKGASQVNLNTGWLSKFEVKEYSIEKQIEIIENLDKVTHTIDLCNAILEKLDLLVKSRFVEMFGDPEADTCTYETKKLKELSIKISDGVHAKPAYTESGRPFLSVVNINRKKVDFTDCKYVSEEAYQKMIKSTHPEKGDVLYTKVGATYGIPAYVDTDIEFCLYVSVCLIKPKHELINSKFLAIQMDMPFVKHQADRRIKGIGVPDLHLNQISEFDIICPPRELQDSFVAFVEQTDKSKSAVKQVLEKAETLKKALMQEYFG